MAGAEQSVIVNTTPEKLFAVITDYEKYPEFLKDVAKIEVHSRKEGETVMTQTLALVKQVAFKIRLTETPNTAVSWTLTEPGKMITKNDGGWRLEDLGDGRTKATYYLDVGVRLFVPGKIVKSLTGTTLPATLQAFKDRAESM